ncbi:MAG: DUF115 domain-containing protein [Gammaproteobacteria bacterium]|nr:DUF115 domain-containing protein [Gammaproteobacteria bacterium]
MLVANKKQQLNIIAKRWPQLADELCASVAGENITLDSSGSYPTLCVNEIHLASIYNRQQITEIQTCHLTPTCRSVTVYGTAHGELIKSLLRRKNIQNIKVVILNVAVFSATLEFINHSQWLRDQKITLVFGKNLAGIDSSEICCIEPACLTLADEQTRWLADCLLIDLSSSFSNTLLSNDGKREQQIQHNLPHITTDKDVSAYFDTAGDRTIYVAGTGPTLEQSFSLLRERGNNILIAADTAVKSLYEHGVKADFVVSIDMHPHIAKWLDFPMDDNFRNHTPLIYFPDIAKETIEQWQGPRYVAYTIYNPYHQQLMRSIPKGVLFSGGSVIHPAIDLAVKMGAKEVVICGADFSFPNNKYHVKGSLQEHFSGELMNSKYRVTNGHGQKQATNLQLIQYLRHLVTYIEEHNTIKFYNASRDGAYIAGCDYLD